MNNIYNAIVNDNQQCDIKKCEETVKDMYGFEELQSTIVNHEFNFGNTIKLYKENDKKLDSEILLLSNKKEELTELFNKLSINATENINFKETQDLINNIKIKETKKQKLFEEVLIMYNTFLLVKNELVNNTKKL